MTKQNGVMDKREKATWLRALRSGKYKQGQGALKVDGKYCCLGVALCSIGKVDVSTTRSYIEFGRFGLSEELQKALAHANDGDGTKNELEGAFLKAGYATHPKLSPRTGWAGFKSIANWIEKNL